VVNCAGYFTAGSPFANGTEELWEKMISVNLLGTARVCRLAIQQFQRQVVDEVWGSRGRIVNISSGAGHFVMPMQSAYGSTKAAVEQLTRVAASDHARDQINVNCVAPGLVETGLARITLEDQVVYESLKKNTPWPRLGKVSDIANAVLFLLSPGTSWITGEVLNVDGGTSLGIAGTY
jgi:NAD(P)-dependent dehydrogenase (short-subunit alcohol dehydrogenase family)